MNESVKKVILDSIKTAAQSTANEIAEICDSVLDTEAKKSLIDVLDSFKARINRTHDSEAKKKTP